MHKFGVLMMKKILNLEYGTIQGAYWMYYGVIISFASIYLLSKNYTNYEIGIILALSSILAVVLQLFLSDIADKSQKISSIGITEIITFGLLLATASMFVFTGKSLILSIVFIMIGAYLTALQPIINSTAFYISRSGNEINFGITRAGGSIAYAILCALLGHLVNLYGIQSIPAAGILVLILLLSSLVLTKKSYEKSISLNPNRFDIVKNVDDEETINLKYFVKRNKNFIIFSLGTAGVFFENSVLNNYLMQILLNVGGNSSQMGSLFSFMAILELPCLIFFSQLRKKLSCETLLKVASIAFTIKIFIIFLAKSVAFIYFGFLFQLISFPIFLSASVHLVDEVMSKGESVKGQALITGMITLSNIFASLIGGAILDLSGASLLLLISTVICIIGTIVVFISVDKIQKNNKNTSHI
jgi:PPP family 3-phenylpropionic acid transporter